MLQAKLLHIKEEKDQELKALLTRCQDAEKKKQVEGAAINVAQLAISNVTSPSQLEMTNIASPSTNQVVIELTNNMEQLKSEVGLFFTPPNERTVGFLTVS